MPLHGEIDTSEIEALIRRAISESDRVALETIEEVAREIFDEAVADWPVKTGESKKHLRMETKFRGNAVEVIIYNDAKDKGGVEYAYMIRGDVQAGKRTWSVLIDRPVRKAEKKLADRIEAAMTDLLGGV